MKILWTLYIIVWSLDSLRVKVVSMLNWRKVIGMHKNSGISKSSGSQNHFQITRKMSALNPIRYNTVDVGFLIAERPDKETEFCANN